MAIEAVSWCQEDKLVDRNLRQVRGLVRYSLRALARKTCSAHALESESRMSTNDDRGQDLRLRVGGWGKRDKPVVVFFFVERGGGKLRNAGCDVGQLLCL